MIAVTEHINHESPKLNESKHINKFNKHLKTHKMKKHCLQFEKTLFQNSFFEKNTVPNK